MSVINLPSVTRAQGNIIKNICVGSNSSVKEIFSLIAETEDVACLPYNNSVFQFQIKSFLINFCPFPTKQNLLLLFHTFKPFFILTVRQ